MFSRLDLDACVCALCTMHPIFNSSIAPHAHVNLHDSSTITTETETEARIKKVGGSDLLASCQRTWQSWQGLEALEHVEQKDETLKSSG